MTGITVNVGSVQRVQRALSLSRRLGASVFDGAAAAYSLRIPAGSTYSGPLIRVRRSTDNAEQGIGAVLVADANGNRWLDTTALLAFCGAGSGFVTAWYDQSNGRHAVQAVPANQPRIVFNGVVDLLNTRPSIVFSGLQWLIGTPQATNISSALVSVVFLSSAATLTQQMFDWRNTADANPLIDDGGTAGFALRGRNNTNTVSTPSYTFSANPHTYSGQWSGGILNMRQDGGASVVAALTGLMSLNTVGIGTNGLAPNLNNWIGRTSEMVFFSGGISPGLRQALERSQGAAFGITVA